MRTLTLLCLAAAPSAALAQCPESELILPLAELDDLGGISVDFDATTGWAIVGAPRYSNGGRADVFQWTGLDFQPDTTLQLPTDVDGDDFGAKVAISGLRAAVASPFADAQGSSGEVHLFRFGPTSLDETILAPTGFVGVGPEVALDGDRVAMIGWGHVNGRAVLIYERGATGWTLTSTLFDPVASNTSEFGAAIELAGDRLLIGDPRREVLNQHDAGAAYLFEHAAGTWTLTETFFAPIATVRSGRFGSALSIDGDRIAIGEPFGSDPLLDPVKGYAHLFEKAAGGWAPLTSVRGSLGGTTAPWGQWDEFGSTLDLRGKKLVVGAPSARDGGVPSGATYLFEPHGVGWVETRAIIAPGYGTQSPADVALGDTQLLIGTPWSFTGPFAGRTWYVDLNREAGIRPYCNTTPNSVGPGALIEMRGPLSLADNFLRLRGVGIPPTSSCFFFYGKRRDSVPFQGGTMCVAPPHYRFPVQQANTNGVTRHVIDLNAAPANAGAGAITSYSTWYFQLAYLDAGLLRTSDALEVSFCR